MTLSLAGTRRDAGVSIAEVNLKLIWDVVSQIKVGERGSAYVIDRQGRLIAHPDISLVLRNTDMSRLPQVRAARQSDPNDPDGDLQVAQNIQGREVLTASAPIEPLGWRMFVELPVEEAYASLYEALYRLVYVLLAALIFAGLAGVFLARRMVGPIQALRAGAARIGGGDFSQRISIKTGDELEGLADQFNDMGARLQDSYADLENKVEQRTSELAQSVGELRALGEVSQAVNSTLDLEQVLSTIVTKAAQLSNTEAGAIYVFDEVQQEFRLRATYGMSDEMIAAVRDQHVSMSGGGQRGDRTGRAGPGRGPAATSRPSPVNEIILRGGLSRAAVGSAAAFGRDFRRAGGAPQGAGRVSKEHGRSAAHLRRPVGARHPEREAVPGDRGEEPPARRGEQAQVPVPRQHEPRAAHADERHPRLHRADPRRHLWRAVGKDGRAC